MKHISIFIFIACTFVLVSCSEHQSHPLSSVPQQDIQDTKIDDAEIQSPTHSIIKQEPSQHKPERVKVLDIPYSPDKDYASSAVISHPHSLTLPFGYPAPPVYNAPVPQNSDEEVLVTVKDMELNRFVHLIFGQYLKDNYFVEQQVEDKKNLVTIYMEKPVRLHRFKRLINNVLATYNVEVRQKDGMTFIGLAAKSETSIKTPVAVSGVYVGRVLPDQVNDDDLILSLMPMNHLDAAKAKQFISTMRPLEKDEVTVLPDNIIAVRGRASEIRVILDMLQVFDRPALQNKQLAMFQLQYIAVDKFITRIREILIASDIPVATEKNKSGVRLVALPEVSSVLAISPGKDWIDQIAYWANTLDKPGVLGSDPRIFIYRPENCKALELADIISGLFSSVGYTEGRTQDPTPLKKANREAGKQIPVGSQATTGRKTLGRAVNVMRTEDLSITVDETRNALVIYTSPVKYEQILKNLKELDIKARQVMLEVMIAEITLVDKLQYGVEWYLRNVSEDSSWSISTVKRLALGESGVLGIFSQSAGDFVAMINMFAKDNLINILATPRLVVLDNQTANFSVGTDVPVVTSEQSASDLKGGIGNTNPSIMRNIEYRKTGIIVNVTPTIYSDGVLRLEIQASLSEAKENDISTDTGSPLILDRSLNTDVILENSSFILLGGLIAETVQEEINGIPFLMDIPFIGNIFKTTSKQTTRTELLIQVRPTILDSFEKAKKETINFRQMLKGVKL